MYTCIAKLKPDQFKWIIKWYITCGHTYGYGFSNYLNRQKETIHYGEA